MTERRIETEIGHKDTMNILKKKSEVFFFWVLTAIPYAKQRWYKHCARKKMQIKYRAYETATRDCQQETTQRASEIHFTIDITTCY